MKKGLALPIATGRGAGLGNEMLVWGKAYVASEVLGLHLTPPAFGLNPRGYARYFGTPSYDWITHRMLRATMPGANFAESDFREREHLGFAGAVKAFAAEKRFSRLPYYVLGIEGMWGGFSAIEGAREFLRSQLLASRGTLANLFALNTQLSDGTATVGIHIRRGDFSDAGRDQDFKGKSNVCIPLDWYVDVARNLRRHMGDRITFLVVSDAPANQLAPFGQEIPCVFTDGQATRDISDLLALSSCDLVVCSISSYSEWAAFFSTGRYLWFAPNLTAQDGLASIWGHEKWQQPQSAPTSRARETVKGLLEKGGTLTAKGIAVDWDGQMPQEALAFLEMRARLARRETDLIRYGVVPVKTGA